MSALMKALGGYFKGDRPTTVVARTVNAACSHLFYAVVEIVSDMNKEASLPPACHLLSILCQLKVVKCKCFSLCSSDLSSTDVQRE